MQFTKMEFTTLEKIDLLQRWILVHSYLYYILDTSYVSDFKFDGNCRQLAWFYDKFPEEWAKSRYGYAMGGFDGSTGFGMVEKLVEKEHRSILRDVQWCLDSMRQKRKAGA